MSNSVFVELRFWLLILSSVIAPCAIYLGLMLKRAISRRTVLAFGFALVLLAGLDVYLLQLLTQEAKASPSLADDHLFVSQMSMALYLMPLMFGGIGVNLISHILIRHLTEAEALYESQHRGE